LLTGVDDDQLASLSVREQPREGLQNRLNGPACIGRDDQINSLAKKRKLTVKDAHIVLNAAILKVGKGG
jgi:hypothetical protein